MRGEGFPQRSESRLEKDGEIANPSPSRNVRMGWELVNSGKGAISHANSKP